MHRALIIKWLVLSSSLIEWTFSVFRAFPKLKCLNAHRPVHEKLVRLTEKARTDKTKASFLTFKTYRNFGLSSPGQETNPTSQDTSAPPCEDKAEVISHASPDICAEDTSAVGSTGTVLERASSKSSTVIKWSAFNVLNSQSNSQYGSNTKSSIKHNLFSPVPFSRATLNQTYVWITDSQVNRSRKNRTVKNE